MNAVTNNNKTPSVRTKTLLYSAVMAITLQATTAHAFIVRDIKVNGLQRVSVGTVLNYLPVQVGEDLEPNSTAEIIRSLYDTGFFSIGCARKTRQCFNCQCG